MSSTASTTPQAVIGRIAPQPAIECWVQGEEPPLAELRGQVILIEVIQLNCTGCFVHALPEAIRLHERYAGQGLKVFALATAFEHFEHNTLNGLQRLLQNGELAPEPARQLSAAGFLEHGRLPYEIPFSVAMDKLEPCAIEVDQQAIEDFILRQIPDFHQAGFTEQRRAAIYRQAEEHLRNKRFHALTFDMYRLEGTPSSILIDRQGILRKVSFGAVNVLEEEIQALLVDE